jgi:hypothetical protein
MKIDNVTKEGKGADGFIIPAGAMFPLGCAVPNHSVGVAAPARFKTEHQVLQHGMYFPPGTMVSSLASTCSM